MSKFKVHIKQLEKNSDLSMLNFDNRVNDMYNDIILYPTKKDLSFFILLFFIWIKSGNSTYLDLYLKENLPKLEHFIRELKKVWRLLKKDEYTDFKDKLWLTDLFKNDTFFIIINWVKNIDYFLIKYKDFFDKNKEILKIITNINDIYSVKVSTLYSKLWDIFIEDDRLDDYTWETLDLSKSITRPIEMRLSSKVEKSFKWLTSLERITSQSPIDLHFIQEISPEIIYNIWDQFKVLSHYWIWLLKNDQFIISTSSWILSWLTVIYLSKKNKSKKNENNINITNNIVNNYTPPKDEKNELIKPLINNLVYSNEAKDLEIKKLGEKIESLEKIQEKQRTKKQKSRLKRIKIKLKNLVNLNVEIEWDTKNK